MSDTSATSGSAQAHATAAYEFVEEEERYTIDIDTGGTFTDGYVVGPHGSVRVKTDTTPHNFAVGVLECIHLAAANLGVTPADLLFMTDIIRLSTTVCTNALINRDGARVGVLMGEDLHAGYASRLSPAMPLDPAMIELVTENPSDDSVAIVDASVRKLLERGARVLVIALSGPEVAARESTFRDLIARNYPRHYLGAVPVLRSSQVTLAIDPAVRVHTAVLNAYVHSVMSRFLYQLEDQLKELGYRNPLLSANADNGTSRVAKTTAICTWGSGPAAGVAAAHAFARSLALSHVIALDIGGTSSDITVLDDFAVPRTVRPRIEGVEVALPTVDVVSVGVGGGSVATIVDDAVVVGPESMGGVPGPASFGLGGDKATLTDALCSLGVFDAANFSGGRKRLDLQRAREVIRLHLADPLGLEVEDAAWLVVNAAVEEINRSVRRVVGGGEVPVSAYTLFAFGGNGGVLAHRIAERLGVERVCMFPLSPVFSAFGMSRLDLVHSYEAMPDSGDVDRTVREMKGRAERDMRGEGVDVAGLSFRLEAEITDSDGSVFVVDLDDAEAAAEASANGRAPGLLRIRATSPSKLAVLPIAGGVGSVGNGKRDVRWVTGAAVADLFDWDTVAVGDVIEGPALLENELTTALIPPGSRVTIGGSAEAMFSFTAAASEAGERVVVEGRAT